MKQHTIPASNYFGSMAHSYPVHPAHYQYKAGLIKEYSRGVVLDAGCADGTYLPLMQATATTVYGIDSTPAMVTSAIFNTMQYKQIHIREENILHLPFPNEMFDTIFCQSTFYYVQEQQQAFAELLRVLKRGGVLVIDVRYEEGKNKHIKEYTMDGDWLNNLSGILFLDDRYPPRVGILPVLQRLFGNSIPPITTHIIKKVKK